MRGDPYGLRVRGTRAAVKMPAEKHGLVSASDPLCRSLLPVQVRPAHNEGGLFMPDISMCASVECPVLARCYRARAMPDMLQAYTSFWQGGEDGCENFWPLDKAIGPYTPTKDE